MRLINRLYFGVILIALVACNTSNKNDGTRKLTTTEDLYELLQNVSQQGFMFGHQDDTAYGINWDGDSARSDVRSVCGDYPAVCGWDLGHLELGKSFNLDGVSFQKIRQEIINQHLRGGINTISWHLDNPFTGGNSWDVSAKDSVVASVLSGGNNYDKFSGWLDTLAVFFNSLQTENGVKIPVLFRPWHEHTGNWFWWGNDHCTPEQYKQLWIMTYDYLKSKGVDNILYAYSPCGGVSEEKYLERYPGDEYVDLLGFDYYQMSGENGLQSYRQVMDSTLMILSKIGKEHNKPIAVTETGFKAIPNAEWWTTVLFPILDKYPVSYVLLWRNAREKENHYYAPYPKQISAQDFVEFYNQPKTLFVNDLGK